MAGSSKLAQIKRAGTEMTARRKGGVPRIGARVRGPVMNPCAQYQTPQRWGGAK